MMKRSVFLFILFFLMTITGCQEASPDVIPDDELGRLQYLNLNSAYDDGDGRYPNRGQYELPDLYIHYIDVGQGDATLLHSEDFTALIDTGRHDQTDVVDYLEEQNVKEIDLLIGSHVHADHIGQMDKIIEGFNVKEVWMNGDEHTTATFERVVDAILNADVTYEEPRHGDSEIYGNASFTVLHPETLTEHKNNNSLVIKVAYGDQSFLFTGDIEEGAENELLERDISLQSDVLKVSHHGSNSSNSEAFLHAVEPSLAIYSAGEGNAFDHPDDDVLARLEAIGANVYGTDVSGNIVVKTNGRDYSVQASEEKDAGTCYAGMVAVNRATVEELQEISQIGPARAEQILNLRPFTSYDDFLRIEGIGQEHLASIEQQGLACFDD